MAGESYLTRDHDTIRRWVEERNGSPATVGSTRTDDDPGLIRLDFPGYSGEGALEEISWEEWFAKFDRSDLVLLFQETTKEGRQSSFNKLISAESAEEASSSSEWRGGDGRPEARRSATEKARR